MTYVISHDIFLEPRALALRARESIAPFGGENKTRTGAHPCRGRHVPTWMHGRRWVMLTLLRIARLGEHNPPANEVRTSRSADASHALTLSTRSVPHHPRRLAPPAQMRQHHHWHPATERRATQPTPTARRTRHGGDGACA